MVPRPRVDRDGPRRVDERPLLGKQIVDGSCLVCDKTCFSRPGLEHISSRLRSMDGTVSPLPARTLLESPLLFKFPVCSPCRRPSAFGFVADGVPLPRPPRPLNWPDELPCPAPRPLDPGGGVDRPLVVPPP